MEEMTIGELEMLFNSVFFKDSLADTLWTYFEHNGGESFKFQYSLEAVNDCTM